MVAVATFAARLIYVPRVLGFRSVDTSSLVTIITIKESSLFMCLLTVREWIIISDTTLEYGCANSGRLVHQATKFCAFAPTIFSIITVVSLPDIQMSVSAHMHRARSATYSTSEMHSSLHNRGSQVRNLPRATRLEPKFWMWLLDS